ncbi:MAG: PsbP-related protein [bacterium]
MVNTALITYIESSLEKGYSESQVIATLAAKGWQPPLIKQGLIAVRSDHVFAKRLRAKSLRKRRTRTLLYLLLILPIAGVGYLTWRTGRLNTLFQKAHLPIATASYTDTGHNYQFDYPKGWTVQANGTQTTFSDPSSGSTSNTATTSYGDNQAYHVTILGTVLSGVVVDVKPYLESGTHADQAQAWAEALSSNGTISTTSLAGQKAYLTQSSGTSHQTVEIVLPGASQLYFVNFLEASSLSSITKGQRTILDSFKTLTPKKGK